MELLRRPVPPSLLHLAVLVACLAGLAAAVSDLPEADLAPPKPLPTRFEQAMAETAALSPDARARLHAARLSEQMLLVHDEEDDVSDGEPGEESGNDNGEGRRRKLATTAKKLGLKPPLLNSGPSMADVNNTFFRWDSVTPNAYVDWRQTMYISPIQRQFQCGSCWTIVAVDSVSMMWAIINNTTPQLLSPQQVCDCATKQCCKGGWPDWAFSYILFNGGIASLDEYPYLAEDSAICNANASTPLAAKITGWELVPPYNARALMKAVSMQPVVAFLSGNANDFQYYSSRGMVKIYDGTCTTDINHAVVVVGYNYTGPSLEGSYWILKNSWFNTWGDGGYMYLAMTPDVRGKCGLHAIPAMYPVYYAGPEPVKIASTVVTTSIPAMYPVYYAGPEPVKIANGPSRRLDDGYDGKWWSRGYSGPVDACANLINPCGGGRCYTLRGIARCDCRYLGNMVEVLSTPTAKCVPRYPCTSRDLFNPCGSGVCRNPGDGTYTCECPAVRLRHWHGLRWHNYLHGRGAVIHHGARRLKTCTLPCCLSQGYAIGTASDGTITCVGVGTTAAVGQTYTTALGDSSPRVHSTLSPPPFLSPPCLSQGYAIGTASDGTITCVGVGTTAAVGQTYTTVPGDSCTVVASTFRLSAVALADLNPFLDCSLAFIAPGACTAPTALPRVPLCLALRRHGASRPQYLRSTSTSKHLGMVLLVTNTSASASASAMVCTSTYTVQIGDTCQSLANTYFNGDVAGLTAANPLICTASRASLLPLQQICISTTSPTPQVFPSPSSPPLPPPLIPPPGISPHPAHPPVLPFITVPQCGQTYTSVAGDTCDAIATKYNIALSTFMSLNPALSCESALKIGLYLCVAPKTALTTVNCTSWYTVLQGDNCPNIWNAANLTEPLFLAINPGIRCQAPYLQVGQKVCIKSPVLLTLMVQTNTSFSLYTVQEGDTLALISSKFVTRCTSVSVSPVSIAAQNNILETSPLFVNQTLVIPCDSRVGILDCGCAESLPVCGADFVTYPSYCDAVCNYAMPVVQDGVCTGCNAACTNRAGVAPLAGYGCTWTTCPYPAWKPLDADCSQMVDLKQLLVSEPQEVYLFQL
ncbi:unnamed protein product [Closterium sp. NIES-64]|nr:unnamed protein product [Closterium sp. NIES-64]